MGNVIEFEMIAAERSSDVRRAVALRQLADEADRGSGRRGIVAMLFGWRRAA